MAGRIAPRPSGERQHAGRFPQGERRRPRHNERPEQRVIPPYRTQKHTLFGRQEGVCNGCRNAFLFRNFTIDHVVPRSKGGTDHIDNLQLLCGACNSKKGNRTQTELIAALRKDGVISI